jgi:hypothetical protein
MPKDNEETIPGVDGVQEYTKRKLPRSTLERMCSINIYITLQNYILQSQLNSSLPTNHLPRPMMMSTSVILQCIHNAIISRMFREIREPEIGVAESGEDGWDP